MRVGPLTILVVGAMAVGACSDNVDSEDGASDVLEIANSDMAEAYIKSHDLIEILESVVISKADFNGSELGVVGFFERQNAAHLM